MKKINVLMIALAALTLSACSAIEDAATVKVNVPDFNINITADVEAATRSGDGMYTGTMTPFSGSYEVSIEEQQFGDLKKYKNLMTGVTISSVTITISQPGTTGGIAANIRLSATNVTDFTLANYNLGDVYQGDANLINFLKNAILQLKNDKVTVSISGETNVASGPLDVVIAVKGIQVLAKTIEF